MLIALEYIKYLLESKKRHGVHSPFIYDLTDNCFSLIIPNDELDKLRIFDSRNAKDNTIIKIEDHGVGSKRMSNERAVKAIFKNSSSKGKYGELLYKLCSHYKPSQVLELGTSLGTGTVRMSLGFPEADIITVEGCPETSHRAESNFNKSDLKNVTLINSTFNDFLNGLDDETYDLIFIDGHHDGTALMQYLERLKPHIHNDSLIVLDDIRWSKSMRNAWRELISSEEYNVSIDLFRLGIITPRQQQVKEHFTLRM